MHLARWQNGVAQTAALGRAAGAYHDPKPIHIASCQAPLPAPTADAHAKSGAWRTTVSPRATRGATPCGRHVLLLSLRGENAENAALRRVENLTVQTERRICSASPPNGIGAHPAGRHHVPSSLTQANYKAQGGSAAGPSDGARSGAAPSCAAQRQLVVFSPLAIARKRSPQAVATTRDCRHRYSGSCAFGIAAELRCRSRRGHFSPVGRMLSRQLRRLGTLHEQITTRRRETRRTVRRRALRDDRASERRRLTK